jgi:UPF0755 protein
MKKLVALLLLVAGCGYAGSRGYDWYTYQVNAPMASRSEPVDFHVDQGESTEQIANDLAAKRLIREAQVFLIYMRYGGSARIEAGDFVLNRNMSMAQIAATLGHARVQQIAVSLPEGYTLQLMAQKAEQAGIGTAADYLAAAQDMTWPYDFLADRPAGAPRNTEGFLFPESYQLDRGSTARGLVKRQLDQFGRAVTPDLRAQAAQAAPGRPAESLYAIVTLASMVEREVNQDGDRPVVCGIYYNRLTRSMPLQVDATVLYGLGKWKTAITDVDLAKDTPYNTYLHRGLPPGPISNPGLASIKACIAPQKSDYLFYFADPKGVTHYARTQTEFLQQQRQFGVSGQ